MSDDAVSPLRPGARPWTADEGLPAPLRDDVRLLGELLGRVLMEAGGEDLLADVDRLRGLTIEAYGSQDSSAIETAEEVVASFSIARAGEVARAFTCYFHLVNLAEEHHRIRVLRDREAQGGPAENLHDSLPAAFAQLSREVGASEAQRRLDRLEFRPVLTAHPTEARRRAVTTTLRRISELVTERDDPRLPPAALAENERRLLAEIDTLWHTAPLRTKRPTPVDEARSAMAVFDQTLFDVLPRVYRRLDDWLLGSAAGTRRPVAPAFVHLGSWIGADRDGNPNVTARITRSVAAIASDRVLQGLEETATQVGKSLVQDLHLCPPTPELVGLWRSQCLLDEELTQDIADRSPGEAHRQVVLAIAARIAATRRRDADLGYADPEELLADLAVVQRSLVRGGAKRAAFGDLQHLIWQVRSFGFHLAELEVRQHSEVHSRALADLAAGGELDPMTHEVLDVFRTVDFLQKRYGVRAAGRYIISFTQSVDDIAAVYELAAHAMGSAENIPVLDVIPLFETYDDLVASVDILDAMIRLPQVAERLARSGRRVEVMLGYSDSSKDVGPVSATLALYEAQRRIADWAQANDIVLTLFHGRGGALGRGGGPANRAVLAQPPHSVDGRFKVTEQGEIIFDRFGDPVIAARHIEQVAAATLLASAPSTERRTSGAARDFAGLAATLDRASQQRFFELVRAEGFAPWFARVTPQEEIGWLALGSRPARRGLSVSSLEDLRAIPWVFAWTQARINLTGWFGLGTALAAVGDTDLLRDAFERWPLFSTMIENVEMSLAKTDERIARRYLDLGDRPDLAGLVLDEMRLTRHWVLATTGHRELAEDKGVLRRGISMRSPYVDALSLLQLRALRVLRERADAAVTLEDQDEVQRLLLLSVNGVAAGLKNTG